MSTFAHSGDRVRFVHVDNWRVKVAWRIADILEECLQAFTMLFECVPLGDQRFDSPLVVVHPF